LVGVDWGMKREAMKRICGALIKSIIDYVWLTAAAPNPAPDG